MPTALHPLALGILGADRLGDGSGSTLRLLTSSLGLTATISTSQYGVALGLTATIVSPFARPLLLYSLITPLFGFSINNDQTIIAPDQMTFPLRPVTARTLLGGPQLQGFEQVVWSYTILQLGEYAHLLSFYNPQSPQVTIVFPDKTGTWVKRAAVMRPPAYGTQTTVVVTGVVLTFLVLRP